MKSVKVNKYTAILMMMLSCTSIFMGCGTVSRNTETSLLHETVPAAAFYAAEKTSPASSATVQSPSKPRVLCGSFIQPWLVADWTQERWDTECRNMAAAGMEYIILQSTVDLNYNTDDDLGQDPDAYELTESDSLYPSELPELNSASQTDSLKKCLEACKKAGIKVVIGLVSDNRWWLYGWGLPEMPKGSSDYVKDSFFAKFIDENADLSNKVADEIFTKYGTKYKEQIFGWYYNNEIWNIDAACKG